MGFDFKSLQLQRVVCFRYENPYGFPLGGKQVPRYIEVLDVLFELVRNLSLSIFEMAH